MNLGPYQKDPGADNVIPLSIFPIIMILCYMFYPESNGTTIIVGSIFILLMVIIALLTKLKQWQYYLSLRLGIMVIYFDVSIVFFAFMLGRIYNNSITAIIFVLLYVVTATLGHRYHKVILSEMKSPKTRVGKFLVFFSFFGSAIGAGIGYWSVNIIGIHLFGPIIFMLLLILIVMFHANFHQVAFSKGS
jgi:hypothetical protein